MDLIFATGNQNKVKEISKILSSEFNLQSLQDIGFLEEIPEPHPSLEENALEKARVIYDRFGRNCFSEDTGLEVEALNGDPGVRSARYAGMEKSANANMRLLLQKLEGIENRKALFRTVIALVWEGEAQLFEGQVSGLILNEMRGGMGFGYDPIFVPDGQDRSFAEMDMEEKSRFSHRARATAKLVDFLASKL